MIKTAKITATTILFLCLLIPLTVQARLDMGGGSTSTETDAAYIRQDGTTTLSTAIPFAAGIMGSVSGVECAVPTELSMRLPPMTVDGVDFNVSPGDSPCSLGATIIRADMTGGEFGFINDTCDNQTVDISAVPSYNEGTGELEGYNDVISIVYGRTFDVYMVSVVMGEGTLYLTIALMESEVNLFSDLMLSFVESRPTYLYKIDNFFNWNTTTCTYEDIPEAGSTITECTGNCDNGSTPTWGASAAVWSYFLAPDCGAECGSGAWTGEAASATHNSTATPSYTWQVTSGGGISTIGDIETTGTVIADSVEVGTLGGLSSWTSGVKAVSTIPDSSEESPVIGMGLAFQANITPTESTWVGLSSGLYGGLYFITPGVAYTGTTNAAMLFTSFPGGGATISETAGVQSYLMLAPGATGSNTITGYTGFGSGFIDGGGTAGVGTWTDFDGVTLYLDSTTITNYYGLKIRDMTTAANEPTTHWGVYNEDRTYLKNYVGIGANANTYTPGMKLYIAGTITDATQYHYGERINLVADPSSDPTSYHAYAMDASLIFQPDFDSEGAYLYGGSLQINTSNHLTCVAGVHPYFTFNGDVTPDIDSYHIFRAWMPAMSKGHIDDFTGVSIMGPTLTDTATAGQIYGIAISDLVGGTGIPYGIYISSFTDAGGYGMYSVPPIATEGKLGIGYLDDAPASLTNGTVWMESDGLHIYYNSTEMIVAGTSP